MSAMHLQQCLLMKKHILVCCSIAFCVLSQSFLHFMAGRISVSPVACGIFSFAVKQEPSEGASTYLSLGSVKFYEVLD